MEATTGVGDLLAQLAAWQSTPPLYAPGSHPLWTDPHVSAGMLAAHLDPDDDAASRRPATIDATVRWVADQLPPGARVLDLGCGPGLYTERLAAAGFDVTGVDFSERSLEYARSRGSGVRYLLGDYRELRLAETFDAVLLIYLDYGALPQPHGRQVLDQVRGWLAPGGRFLFDVATPVRRAGGEQRRSWGVEPEGFWSARPHAWLTRTLRYDDGPTYLDEHVVVTAAESRIYRVWERCFTEPALRAELAAAGLALRSTHGDLTGAPFDPVSSTALAAVATLA